jgi:phytoene dehydrogenase-like protein
MDFSLPPALVELRDRTRTFVRDVVIPFERDPRRTEHGPTDELRRELNSARHGLRILPLDGTFTPMLDGTYLWRTNDHGQTRREIARHSRLDAEAYDEYSQAMVEMGRFVKPIMSMTPPDPTRPGLSGIRDLMGLGSRFRDLSLRDRYNQLQLMTMSAVDFLDQWFETDVLKATMSASGIIGTFLGVRSPGTAYVLLHHYMGEIDGAFRSWGLARGGTGAISNAIASAARAAGVEIRSQVEVDKILVRGNRAHGVVLKSGDEIRARVAPLGTIPRPVSSLSPSRDGRRVVANVRDDRDDAWMSKVIT